MAGHFGYRAIVLKNTIYIDYKTNYIDHKSRSQSVVCKTLKQ